MRAGLDRAVCGVSGYVLERYTDMGSAYACRRLVEEGRRLGMDVSVLGVADLMETSDGELLFRGRPLIPRSFVLNRYREGSLPARVNALCGRGYSSWEAFSRYVDKRAQVRDIASAAFRMPRWLVAHATLSYEEAASALGGLFVVKGPLGSEGREVWLVDSEAALARVLAETGADRELLFQECIVSSLGHDVRAFVVQGEVVACMERTARHGFRANYALGAEVRPRDIDEEIRLAAHDIWRTTGLSFFGLDLLEGTDGYCFCEINAVAGMRGIERATGVDVARRVMETIAEDLG